MAVGHNITVFKPPLPSALVDQLVHLWEDIFQADYAAFRAILTGDEGSYNQDIFYLIQQDKKAIGTCHLTISIKNPELGGLGEVVTLPAFRGQGLAAALCTQARNDFRAAGGQALFLGTVNPAAGRTYHRLGWRKLAGANVMASITNADSPETFLANYFNKTDTATVAPGSVAERIPMIPLILSPHGWQLMDANTRLISTRYADQTSCMGLYPRYFSLEQDNHGAWFSARTNQGRTVGLASARLDEIGNCQVDGFAHHNHPKTWKPLIEASLCWAADHGADSCWISVSLKDEEKISQCETMGFCKAGAGAEFQLSDRMLSSIRLKKA